MHAFKKSELEKSVQEDHGIKFWNVRAAEPVAYFHLSDVSFAFQTDGVDILIMAETWV